MSDYEKILTQKLDRLSDSVDCFDKIAEKAYSEENNGFDDEFTVSNVENIPYRKKTKLIPVIAVFAAFCIAVCFAVPNLSRINSQFFLGDDTKSEKLAYISLKKELDYELENFDYSYSDYQVSYFNNFSLFINPLYIYHFDTNQYPDAIVRVYTKCAGTYDNKKIMTNQIYLVLYEHDCSDENIISIVDTKAKFTQEEIEEISNNLNFTPLDVNSKYLVYTAEKNDSLFSQKQKNPLYSQKHMEFICNNFDYGKNTTLSYKNKPVNVSSFVYRSVYKLGDNIYNLTSDILTVNYTGSIKFGYLADIYYINPYISSTENSIWQFDEKQLKDCWNDIASQNGIYDNNSPINPYFTDLDEAELPDNNSNDVSTSNLNNSDITEITPYSETDNSSLNASYFVPENVSAFKIHSNSIFSSNSVEIGGFIIIDTPAEQSDTDVFNAIAKMKTSYSLYCVNFDKNNPSIASFKPIETNSLSIESN